jgi:hypothetical protein
MVPGKKVKAFKKAACGKYKITRRGAVERFHLITGSIYNAEN